MNSKQVKKVRKIIRETQSDVVEMFEKLKAWPFKMRLSLAWQLIRGVRKPVRPKGE